MESNHPSGGLPRPAGFEDRMGHQTPAAPLRTIPLHPCEIAGHAARALQRETGAVRLSAA
jgi:hypothetical protein